MRISEAISELKTKLFIDYHTPHSSMSITPMLWGTFGIGKTQIVHQVAKELSTLINKKVNVLVINMAIRSPIEIGGVPAISEDKKYFSFLPPEFIHTINQSDEIPLLFFDEINTAPPSTQVMGYRVALDRYIGDFPLVNKHGEKALVVLAGNRAQDKGATYEMPFPLLNRCSHIEVETNVKDFTIEAIRRGFEPSIIAFLNTNELYLHVDTMALMKEKNNKPVSGEPAKPSPRTWEMVDTYIKNCRKYNLPMTKDGIAGLVGLSTTEVFYVYNEVHEKMPDIDKILLEGIDFKIEGSNDEKYQDIDFVYFFLYSLTSKYVSMFLNKREEKLKKSTDSKSNEKLMSDFTPISYNFFKALSKLKDEIKMLAFQIINDQNIRIHHIYDVLDTLKEEEVKNILNLKAITKKLEEIKTKETV